MMQSKQLLPRPAGRILVDQLRLHGADHVFCVPGESYLAVLDALYDSGIEVTVCRQEGGAAMMAEAYGKLTGKPGICMVTRAPGATNAYAGVHIAAQDSTPMILFVGQVENAMLERDAFQEMDYAAVFGSQCKWAVQADDADRLPEIIARAYHTAVSGRPGPVVIALPEDMLAQEAAVADARPNRRPVQAASEADWAELENLLDEAEKPLAVLGGSTWSSQAVADFAAFAERRQLPVAVQFRRQMLFPADHPCYAGDLGFGANPELLQAFREADLIMLAGGRFSEVPSQSYTLLDIPAPQQKLVHIHPDNGELNRVYQADLPIQAAAADFAAQAAARPRPAKTESEWCRRLHGQYLAWSDASQIRIPGELQLGALMQYLLAELPPETVITNGAGNYAIWVHRFWRFRTYGSQLAPTSGSMGYGLPAAVAAKRVFPQRPVVCFAGDGCFLMHGQEFATAVQYGLPITVIVVDNGMYGTIRMHQEKRYPGRVSATSLKNPDFAAYARAFGGHGETVRRTAEFADAWQRAQASGLPSIIHCLIDPEAISPTATLSGLRGA